MALDKVTYVDGETVITAENLNDIQDAIIELEQGGTITVDSALSSTSENPVQNKVINQALGAKAPLASPTFTGTPKAPTAASGTNTTQLATTAFVQQEIAAASEVFWATYNVTTYAEIKAADDAGKLVMLKAQVGYELPLTQISSSSAQFGVIKADAYYFVKVTSANVWSVQTGNLVDWNDYADDIGDKTDLTTSTKTNLVAAINELNAGKLNNNLGSSEAGKFLVVGSDGAVTTMTLATWQAGSY